MGVLHDLYEALPDLSKNERKAADYFLRYPRDVQRFTCDTVAENCGISRSAVIRLCQKLGFRGYADFKAAVLSDRSEPPVFPAEKNKIPAQEDAASPDVLSLYCRGFEQLRPLVGSPELEAIADLLLYARRVFTVGLDHSEFSSNQLTFRLNRLGIRSYAFYNPALMSSQLEIAEAGTVMVIISISGQKSYLPILESCRSNRIKTILVTMNPQSAAAKVADHVIVLPFLSHLFERYLLDDAVTFYLFIELLMEAIYKKKKNLEGHEG